ncbi:MAG: gamma-glutamyl-gamma-aminobutyrate hydrolase family protein [Opitutales bacterium]|nr:gamma-glutamyl-gamma-aminobutyrate hydrolase family protein [Opitutales bacterium]
MKGRRPRVLVTGPDRGGYIAWFFTRLAVWRAGGRAVRARPRKAHRVPPFDAVVIGGGADVDPNLYGGVTIEALREAARRERRRSRWTVVFWGLAIFFSRKLFSLGHRAGVDEGRDALERRLLDDALRRGVPVLGICRGAQLMNVVRGGDLHQDIGTFYTESPKVDTVFPRKPVLLEPDSRLAAVLGGEEALVNSLHNQAVNRLGEGVRVVAREKNGIAQGVEIADHPFAVGIQWHPEYLPQSRRQQRLFHALVEAARERGAE